MNLLSSQDLNDLTVHSYVVPCGFETEEHNLSHLWRWEAEAFQDQLADCRSILVAGAGGGREMIALRKMGMDADGFDASPRLVEACRQNMRAAGVAGTVWLAGPGEVPADAGVYDALVIGRGVYHHIPGRRNRITFLNGCRAHMKAGSTALIGDFLTRGPAKQMKSRLVPEPGDHLNCAFFHFFTREEIELECREAGFELVAYKPTPFPGASNLAHAIAKCVAEVAP